MPLQELGLPIDLGAPLLGFIGRLDQQKGVDLILESYEWLLGQGAQLVLLGSGRADLEDALRCAVHAVRAVWAPLCIGVFAFCISACRAC